MIQIRFPDIATKRRALGALAGRYSFRSWATGEMIVSESALVFLAVEGMTFTVDGPVSYERTAETMLARPSP